MVAQKPPDLEDASKYVAFLSFARYSTRLSCQLDQPNQSYADVLGSPNYLPLSGEGSLT